MDKDIKSYLQEFNFHLFYMLWFSIPFYLYKNIFTQKPYKNYYNWYSNKLEYMYIDQRQISLNVNY